MLRGARMAVVMQRLGRVNVGRMDVGRMVFATQCVQQPPPPSASICRLCVCVCVCVCVFMSLSASVCLSVGAPSVPSLLAGCLGGWLRHTVRTAAPAPTSVFSCVSLLVSVCMLHTVRAPAPFHACLAGCVCLSGWLAVSTCLSVCLGGWWGCCSSRAGRAWTGWEGWSSPHSLFPAAISVGLPLCPCACLPVCLPACLPVCLFVCFVAEEATHGDIFGG